MSQLWRLQEGRPRKELGGMKKDRFFGFMAPLRGAMFFVQLNAVKGSAE